MPHPSPATMASDAAGRSVGALPASTSGVLLAAAKAAPAIIAPVVVTTAMLWAKLEYAAKHHQEVAHAPATVSDAISDPAIGQLFANWMIVAALLLSYAIWRVARLLGTVAGEHLPTSSLWRNWARKALLLFGLCQGLAVAGIIILSQWTHHDSTEIHTVGSYLLFVGHTAGIAVSGGLCWVLFNHGEGQSYISKTQFVGASWVVMLAAIFLALFILRDVPMPIEGYWLRLWFTWIEMALITSFLAYLALFTPGIFRHELALQAAAARVLSDARPHGSCSPDEAA